MSSGTGEKKMTPLGIVITGIFILSIAAIFFYFKSPSFSSQINIRDIGTFAQIAIAFFAFLAFIYTFIANERSEKLFTGANLPLIDVTPIAVGQVPGEKGDYFTTTFFNVANYSGFDAYDIGIDLKYKGAWIVEWLKADKDSKGKPTGQEIVDGKTYISAPESKIPELKAGDTRQAELQIEKSGLAIAGQYDLEKEVCSKGEEGAPVFVRVSWRNKQNHIFDEVHRYKLVCTKADPGGYSFTFIPDGILSKKDSKFGL
jgi:hypothetical protein